VLAAVKAKSEIFAGFRGNLHGRFHAYKAPIGEVI
jgi:hypothetical protein